MKMNVSNAVKFSNSLRITFTFLTLLMAQFTGEVVGITLLKIDLAVFVVLMYKAQAGGAS